MFRVFLVPCTDKEWSPCSSPHPWKLFLSSALVGVKNWAHQTLKIIFVIDSVGERIGFLVGTGAYWQAYSLHVVAHHRTRSKGHEKCPHACVWFKNRSFDWAVITRYFVFGAYVTSLISFSLLSWILDYII